MQLFNPDGEFIRQWDDIWWPCDMCIDANDNMYIAEVGGIFMGDTKDPPVGQPTRANHSARSEWRDPERVGDG